MPWPTPAWAPEFASTWTARSTAAGIATPRTANCARRPAMDIPDAAVNAVSDAIGLDQYDARDALEAAAPILAAVRAKDLRAALRSITARITTSAADFSTY